MRIDTVFKYHFPFEYWTLAADMEGDTNYVLKSEGVGFMLPAGPNSLTLITQTQMAIPMQVRNIRDRSGNVVTQVDGAEYPMYVHSAEPVLDPFSNVVAWRHTLRRNPPRDFESLVDRLGVGIVP